MALTDALDEMVTAGELTPTIAIKILLEFDRCIVKELELLKQKTIFGLPGNPISSAACFRFFVYPFIEKSLGISSEKPIKAILKNNFKLKHLIWHCIIINYPSCTIIYLLKII